jgi:methylmalonyl-CoA mutase N-terminal domain/subunit
VNNTNLLPPLLACTRAYVTLGEMCTTLASVFGIHEEVATF